MYAKILVPVDGSQASTAGLTEAIKIAKSQGSEIRLVHVVNDLILEVGYGAGIYACDALEVLRKAGRNILDAAEMTARREGVKTNSVLLDSVGGPASDLILGEAKTWRRTWSSWVPTAAADLLGSSWEATPRPWCAPAPSRCCWFTVKQAQKRSCRGPRPRRVRTSAQRRGFEQFSLHRYLAGTESPPRRYETRSDPWCRPGVCSRAPRHPRDPQPAAAGRGSRHRHRKDPCAVALAPQDAGPWWHGRPGRRG